MDTRPNTVKIPNGVMYVIIGKMDTFIPEAGKRSGYKLTWRPWIQKYLLRLGAALVKLVVVMMVMEMTVETMVMAETTVMAEPTTPSK